MGLSKSTKSQELEKRKRGEAITSLVFSILAFLFWVFLNIDIMDPDALRCSSGGVHALFGLLAIPIYTVLITIATALGIDSLKSKARKLAIASLIITTISLILVILYFTLLSTTPCR